eukprot:11273450-Karenia_brevis.AAC.1
MHWESKVYGDDNASRPTKISARATGLAISLRHSRQRAARAPAAAIDGRAQTRLRPINEIPPLWKKTCLP